MSELPFSAACERNRDAILTVLREVFADRRSVLEIGSGTGQHAVYFSAELPQLVWHSSDRAENHAGILAWIRQQGTERVMPPLLLDVSTRPWPELPSIDAAFSANTAHIMSWKAVCDMFAGLAALLPTEAPFALYGPFNAGGRFTSDSNRAFDASLRQRDSRMGLRDLDDLVELGVRTGFELANNHAMPANNRLLLWRRRDFLP